MKSKTMKNGKRQMTPEQRQKQIYNAKYYKEHQKQLLKKQIQYYYKNRKARIAYQKNYNKRVRKNKK